MRKIIKKPCTYILGLFALVLIVMLVVFMIIKATDGIEDITYCSDLCPDESSLVPFQVYERNLTEDECRKLNGTPNYAYGWSKEYLGCTPEGYKSLSEATEEMWSNNNK